MIDADKNREERPPELMSRFKVAFTDTGYLPNKNAQSLTAKKSAPVIKNQRKSAYYSTYRYIFIVICAGLAQHGG